jgi:hypothetical protein
VLRNSHLIWVNVIEQFTDPLICNGVIKSPLSKDCSSNTICKIIKTKKTYMPLTALAIVLLLSACLVVPSSVYAEVDDSHEKGKKDNGDKDQNPTCDSEKYEKQCDATNYLTVNAVDSNGNTIKGIQVWLETPSGDVIKEAFTPHIFVVKSDTPYRVVLANFGSNVFDHWQDQTDNTNRHRIISVSSDTTLNGVYAGQGGSTNSVQLTILSTDSNGNTIKGMQVWLETPSGHVVKEGFTPHIFVVKPDTYRVVLANFGSNVFDHWQDQTDNTNRHRIISVSSDTTLNGVYRQN